MTKKKKGILERLLEGPVLGDGGYLLELEKRGWVRAGPFTPEVALLYPNALRELHIEFREAGSEVLQALTFYASRDKLATVGLEDQLEALNRSAVRVAREVAGDQCLVAGNISLTWMYEPGSPSAADRVRKTFDEQLAVQVDEGVDFIVGETFSWLGEALIAVERAKSTGLPAMVTICFENKDETAEGHECSRCRENLVRRRSRHCWDELPAAATTHPATDGTDAQSGLGISRLSTRSVPDSKRQTRLHKSSRVSLRARSAATHAQRHGGLCRAGSRYGNQLHRRVLWDSRNAHPRNGACPQQAAGGFPHLEERRRKADVGVRILRPRQHEGVTMLQAGEYARATVRDPMGVRQSAAPTSYAIHH